MKKYYILFLFLINFSHLFSQQILNSNSASWAFVTPGKIVGKPCNTSYGTVFIDDSRLLHAIDFKGKTIWEKSIQRGSIPFFTVLPQDFIVLVTGNGKKMQLLNPTGTEIWNISVNFTITDNPYPGLDGRFFVRNEETLACYGLNGIKKWQLNNLQQCNFPITEFPDGSLFIFLKNDSNSQNDKAIRLSPFGEILEEITLNKVFQIVNHEDGVLITFEDGSSALLNVKNNLIETIWKIEQKSQIIGKQQNKCITDNDKKNIVYLQFTDESINTYYINPQNGKINKSFIISDFNSADYVELIDENILFVDGRTVLLYNSNGTCLWYGLIPIKIKTDYVKYIINGENYLITFYPNWDINAFRIIQKTATKQNKLQKKTNAYSNFYNIDTSLFDNYLMNVIDSDISSQETITLLNDGNYGAKERYWIQKLLSGCKAYEGILFTRNSRSLYEQSVFERDTAGLERMISQLSLFGTNTFCDFTAYLIKYETNRTILNAVLNSLAKNGYDPEGKILESLYLLAKKTDIKDSTISTEICDCVYSICKFMGKPAFNKQGKEILSTFIYPRFNQKTKEYARETLKKISALDL